jgi:hypothetical protein
MNHLVSVESWGWWAQIIALWLAAAAIIIALVAIQVMLTRKFTYLIPWPTNSNAIIWLLRFLWQEAAVALVTTAGVVIVTIGLTVYLIVVSHL